MPNFDEYYNNKQDYHVKAYQVDEPFQKYINSIVDFFEDKKGDTILNVGAGEGLEGELLLDRGHRVDLLDISGVARDMFNMRNANKSWIVRSTYYVRNFLDFDSSKQYDWVLMPNTLHWIEEEEKAVQKIRSLARKGAYITVTDFPRSELDLRGYTRERLEELFPNAEIRMQDDVRWVIIT